MLLRRVQVIRTLSWRERVLLVEAVVALGLARLLILTIPFRWIVPRLEARPRHRAQMAHRAASIRQIEQVLGVVSRRTPWRSNCLAQGLAGKAMLARRGIASELSLGVAREDNRLAAHAWLQCDGRVITGAEGRERYTVISTFGGET